MKSYIIYPLIFCQFFILTIFSLFRPTTEICAINLKSSSIFQETHLRFDTIKVYKNNVRKHVQKPGVELHINVIAMSVFHSK